MIIDEKMQGDIMADESIEDEGHISNYAGFWIRSGASLIDTMILSFIILPISIIVLFYGWQDVADERFLMEPVNIIINWFFPFVATISFWVYKQATPGKMIIKAKIIDAKTGGKPTLQQFIIRYLGYFVAFIPLGLGIFWVAWDSKKQGWHDKMAGTLVVKEVNPL